jgi:hypothetical protein
MVIGVKCTELLQTGLARTWEPILLILLVLTGDTAKRNCLAAEILAFSAFRLTWHLWNQRQFPYFSVI